MDRYEELLALAANVPVMKAELREQNSEIVEQLFENVFSKLRYSARGFRLRYSHGCAEIQSIGGTAVVSAFNENVHRLDRKDYGHNVCSPLERACRVPVEGIGNRLQPDKILELVEARIRAGDYTLIAEEAVAS